MAQCRRIRNRPGGGIMDSATRMGCQGKEMREIKIENAQDLIDAIILHPQFRDEVLRHLLTQELLQMPVKFEQFSGEVSHRLDNLEADVGVMKGDIGTLQGHVGTLQGHVGTLQSDVSTLKGHVADLRGKDYERSIRFRVRERVGRAFMLVRPSIALSQNDPLSRELDSAINRAISGNRVSDREIESLLDTDIIVSDAQNSHVAVEISLTADERDITRARERADILGRVTGGSVNAAIAAQIIPDGMREIAASLNVAVMQIEYKG